MLLIHGIYNFFYSNEDHQFYENRKGQRSPHNIIPVLLVANTPDLQFYLLTVITKIV